jgi:hypothetical protein
LKNGVDISYLAMTPFPEASKTRITGQKTDWSALSVGPLSEGDMRLFFAHGAVSRVQSTNLRPGVDGFAAHRCCWHHFWRRCEVMTAPYYIFITFDVACFPTMQSRTYLVQL